MTETEATVFIVDDEALIRESLRRLIRSAGWQAEGFASAEEFLTRLPISGQACLILDVRMPGMSGPELLKEMVARNIALPVIFLSGYANFSVDEARNLGAVAFLSKPVDQQTLFQTIRLALEQRGLV
jgi:FixJ family two-component response regulator